MTTSFAELDRVDPSQLERLHVALEKAALREGLLDVAYRTIDTPVGSLLVAATERGIVRVAFASEGHDAVLETLAARLGPGILKAPARLDPAARARGDSRAASPAA